MSFVLEKNLGRITRAVLWQSLEPTWGSTIDFWSTKALLVSGSFRDSTSCNGVRKKKFCNKIKYKARGAGYIMGKSTSCINTMTWVLMSRTQCLLCPYKLVISVLESRDRRFIWVCWPLTQLQVYGETLSQGNKAESVRSGQMTSSLVSTCSHITPHSTYNTYITGTGSGMHNTYSTHHRHGVGHIQPYTAHTTHTTGTGSDVENCMEKKEKKQLSMIGMYSFILDDLKKKSLVTDKDILKGET